MHALRHPICNPVRRPVGHLIAQLACTALLLAGCGGGGDAGPSSGGTGTAPPASSFAAGPITGFGSIIVNGVRFDDSSALVTDDEGGASSKDLLRLGMTANVKGGAISDDGTGARARATEISVGAAVVGPVSAVNTAAKSLVVLGQTVLVLDTTVIDAGLVGGFAGIAVGSVLEVHGTLDATTGTDHGDAARAEAVAASGYKLRGVVAGLEHDSQDLHHRQLR